jgi:hypothetical protein
VSIWKADAGEIRRLLLICTDMWFPIQMPQKLVAMRLKFTQSGGRRSFWGGVRTNTFFFVLGLAVSAVSLSSTQVFALFGLK